MARFSQQPITMRTLGIGEGMLALCGALGWMGCAETPAEAFCSKLDECRYVLTDYETGQRFEDDDACAERVEWLIESVGEPASSTREAELKDCSSKETCGGFVSCLGIMEHCYGDA